MTSISPIPDPRSPMSEPISGVPDPMTHASGPTEALETHFTGHTVVDERGGVIVTVSDVIYGGDAGRSPTWLVVDVGLLGVSHYAPAEQAILTDRGEIVAGFDKRQVKSAPKAHRDHIVTRELETQIRQHYHLVG